jgi:hypothetical protein
MPTNRGLLYWLAYAARTARLQVGATAGIVALRADVHQATIYRFEQGARWPSDPERLIRGYAQVAGVDQRGLWRRAFACWEADAG